MWPYKTYTLVHIVANDEGQSISIKNTLENDTRCKSIRPSSITEQTVYIKIKTESEINLIEIEYQSKFNGCFLTFSPPVNTILLPNQRLGLKKFEVPLLYMGIIYGSSVSSIIGTGYYNEKSITPEIVITGFFSSIFPALSAFFLKLQKKFD